jgi:hypothetical protein
LRSRRYIIIGVLVFLCICSGSALLFLRSEAFQNYAASALISRLEKATGLHCRIELVKLDFLRGRFVLTGLHLTPQTGAPGPMTVNVDEIRTDLSISSFWHFRVRLAGLDVIRPFIELTSSEGEKGESSWNPEELLRTLKVSLRLEAARVRVQDGRIKINDRTSPFNVLLDDLDCEVHYSTGGPGYRIHLSYKNSRLFWEQRDIVHDLELDSDLSLQGLQIDSFKFRHGTTLFAGSGSVTDWKSPLLLIHTAGTFNAKDLILADPSLFEGRGALDVIAELRYDKEGVSSKGRFMGAAGGYRKMNYSGLSGRYEIEHDVLHLRDVSGRIARGSFTANGEIQLRESNKAPNRMVILAKNVPVIDAGRVLNLPLVNFENAADSSTTITWRTDEDLKAECAAYLHGLERPSTSSARSTLLDGSVSFTVFGTGGVHISSAVLNSRYTSVRASGGERALFHLHLATNRLSEPLALIAGFSPPVSDILAKQPDLMHMAGEYEFDGDVRIKSSDDVDYLGEISVRDGAWRSYKVDSLFTSASFVSPHLDFESLAIRNGDQSVQGSLKIQFAEKEEISSLQFRGSVRQIALSSLRDFGAETGDISGILSGNGTVQYDRGRWDGEGWFSVEAGKYRGEPFDALRAQVTLDDGNLRIVNAEIARGSARLDMQGDIDLKSNQLNLSIRLTDLSLQEVPVVKEKRLPIQARVNATGALKGTTDNPAFSGSFEIKSLRYDSWNLGNGKGRLEFRDRTMQTRAELQSDIGKLAIHADVSTDAGYPGKAVVDFEDLDVQKIVPARTPAYLQQMRTLLKGRIEANGKLEDLSTVRISGALDGARFKIHDYELRNSGQIQFLVTNGNLRLNSVKVVGEGTSLILNGTVPLEDSSNMDVSLNGSLNLGILADIDKKLHVAGAAALDIRAGGARKNPQVIGRASFHDAKLDYSDLPFHFSAMQGDIIFSRNLVRLENFRGSAASGTLQLSGTLEHQNAVIRSINMGISIRNARLPYPKDFRSIVNAELLLNGSTEVQVLSGDVDVVRTEYVRSFNLLEQLASRNVSQSGPLTTDPYLLGLRLNVDIHSDNGLVIDNELARLRGNMRLNLRGTPAYPSLTGRVEATEGTIFFRGNHFEIQNASADFIDRNRINPVLEIRAEADVMNYQLILNAMGDLDHLNLNVTSDPPMSTVDVLSLLTTGKTGTGTTETSRQQSEMAGVSAASVLSENLTGVIGKRVQRIFGLETFRVDPFLAGAENDPTARITVSERLSKDLVVTFSRNLTTNQEQIVMIEYNVGKNLSVVATRDEDGKYGLDFRFRKRLR